MLKEFLEISRIYEREPVAARLHILTRAILCPFSEILPHFPESGKILDVGCGHGTLVNLLFNGGDNRGRKLLGIDHDPNKIDTAKKYENIDVKFLCSSLERLDEKDFDAISVVDVLYSIKLDKWKTFFDRCFDIMKPGGILIVKEVIDKPRWKYWAIMAEEKLAVELFRITKGQAPHIESRQTYIDAITGSGFQIVEEKAVNRNRFVSHYLFVARKK